MADITKCKGHNCDLKESCYRYTAPTSEYCQAWFTLPVNVTPTDCDYYWQTTNEEEPKR